MTFAPLTDDHGADLLTWYRAAFPARTSAPPEKAQASTAPEAASGVKWHESSVRYDRASSLWKTHRSLWEEDLPWSSVTLPKWGSMRDGVCWERMMSELPTGATDAGLWRTPAAREPGVSAERLIPIEGGIPGGMNRHFDKHTGRMAQIGLMQQVMLRQKWPTPTVNDSKNSTLPPSQINHDNIPGALIRNGEAPGGQLNPTWVEWLMGWPLGWTDLKPLETDKFREWQQQHSGFCQIP
jgi:hypothetical protein